MAVVAHAFTHFDVHAKKGDVFPDDHELVTLAPHLFVQKDPEPEPTHRPVRLGRENLVNPPGKKKRPAGPEPESAPVPADLVGVTDTPTDDPSSTTAKEG